MASHYIYYHLQVEPSVTLRPSNASSAIIFVITIILLACSGDVNLSEPQQLKLSEK